MEELKASEDEDEKAERQKIRDPKSEWPAAARTATTTSAHPWCEQIANRKSEI